MTNHLKPRPFCGCTKVPKRHGNGIGDYWLECFDCGASTRLREDGASSEKDWNRRPDLAASTASDKQCTELTPPVRRILGMMLWETAPIAGALRAADTQINNRAEDEQAAVLHWLLGFALARTRHELEEAGRSRPPEDDPRDQGLNMARPRMNDEVSIANIIARMLPGKTYGASAIASKLHLRTDAIRPLLEQMVKDGALEISRERPAMIGFRRPKVEEVVEEPLDTTLSVAGPLVHVRLDGTLSGYDAEISRRVALCMTLRGAR